MARILETLERHALFTGLPSEEFASLLLDCRMCTPLRGGHLYEAGDEADAFYILVSGRVKLANGSPSTREHVMELVGPGDAFALLPLFDARRYGETATALEDSVVIRVPREAFLRLLSRRPEVAGRVAREVAAQAWRLRERLEAMSTRSVPARVAAHILGLADRESGGGHPGAIVDLGAARGVVAGTLGTVPRVLVRTLRALEREGLVLTRGRRVEILEPERLRGLAEGNGKESLGRRGHVRGGALLAGSAAGR